MRAERLALVGAATASTLALSWRVWADPGGRALGHVIGEQLAHLWLQWVFTHRSGPGLLTYEGVLAGETVVMAPTDALTHLAVALLQPLLGIVAAYNLVLAAYFVAGGAALGALARRLGASLPAAMLAAAVGPLDPALRAYLSDGRYDSVAVTSVFVALWALVAAAQEPSRGRLVGLAVAGAAVAWAGPNPAIVGLPVLLPAGLVALVRSPGRKGLALAAVAAAGLALPWMWIFADTASRTNERMRETHEAIPAFERLTEAELQRRRPMAAAVAALEQVPAGSAFRMPAVAREAQSGQDTISLLCGGLRSVGPRGMLPLAPLFGLVLLVLLRPRRGLPALLFFAGLWWLSTGHGPPHTPGFPLGDGRRLVPAAAAVVGELPGLAALRNYGMFAVVATAVGVVGAALLPRIGPLLLLAWGIEASRRAPPLPTPVTDLRPPPGLIESLAARQGAVLVFPHGNEVGHLLQMLHGRPSLDTWYAVGTCFGKPSWAVDFFQAMGQGRRPDPAPLRANGVSDIVLFEEAMSFEAHRVVQRALVAALGPPTRTGAGWELWAL